jgi:hypothetical protein
VDPRSTGHVGYSEAEARRGEFDDLGRTGKRRSALAAIGAVAALAAAAAFLLLRGGDPSDDSAIRAWFTSPAGGAAPARIASAIHVGACTYVGAPPDSRQVLKCDLSTDAPNPALHTCFVISGGNVVRGGWQLASVDGCNALRFDGKTGMLVDTPAHARYRVLAR